MQTDLSEAEDKKAFLGSYSADVKLKEEEEEEESQDLLRASLLFRQLPTSRFDI